MASESLTKEYPKLVKLENGTKARVLNKAEEDALEGKVKPEDTKKDGKKKDQWGN